MEDDDLLERLDSLGLSSFSGTLYRHTSPDRNPLEGLGARLFGGRWNPKDSVSTIYLARPIEACVAEFRRMAQGQARGVESFLPRTLHTLRAEEIRVLDLRSEDALEEVGLSTHDIVSRDWGPCQRVGAAAHFLGAQGVRARSASGKGEVIATFEPTLAPGQLKVVDSTPIDEWLDSHE